MVFKKKKPKKTKNQKLINFLDAWNNSHKCYNFSLYFLCF